MKTYRNLAHIQKKDKLGKRLSGISLAVLVVGMLVSFVPTWYPPDVPGQTALIRFFQEYWMTISFVALPAGFILASLGSYHVNRFARRRWPGMKEWLRPDEVLERSFKGLDDKYAYFSWSLPASYLLVGPCGILLFALRSDRGRIVVNGDKWREPFSIGRIFTVFAREGLGNPRIELEDQTQRIAKLLAEATEEESNNTDFSQVPINGAAVFINQQTEIDATSPSVPALRPNQVKAFIRTHAKEVRLQTSTLRALTRYLESRSEQNDGEG
ncbi:MAG: hypothetical protein AAF702_33935 [Chloroflexota bacterium]